MDPYRRSGSPSDQRNGSHRRRPENGSRWDMRSRPPPDPSIRRAATTRTGPDPAEWMSSRSGYLGYMVDHDHGRRRGTNGTVNGESSFVNGANHARPPTPQRHSSTQGSRFGPYDRALAFRDRDDHSRNGHAPHPPSQRGPSPSMNGYGPSPPRTRNGTPHPVDRYGPPPQVDGHGSPPRVNGYSGRTPDRSSREASYSPPEVAYSPRFAPPSRDYYPPTPRDRHSDRHGTPRRDLSPRNPGHPPPTSRRGGGANDNGDPFGPNNYGAQSFR